MASNKKLIYSFVGSDTPIQKEDLEVYGDRSLFYVSSRGKVLFLDPNNRYTQMIKELLDGEYMYKDQLEERLFSN